MIARLMLTALAALWLAGQAQAHAPNQPPHQLYRIGDLTLESGEVIKDFAISYVTHGTLNAKKSNAILMVTAISGNHHRLDFLIGPGKALDTDKYFIICTDAIGNGLTTSPSNSTAQPRMKFPKFLIRDMVTSQKKLMRASRHRPRRRGGRPVDGRHAGAAMGREPSGLHGQPGRAGAARQDAGLDRRGAGGDAARRSCSIRRGTSGDYAAPPEHGIRLWRDILSFLAGAQPGNVPRPVPEPAGRAAVAAGSRRPR